MLPVSERVHGLSAPGATPRLRVNVPLPVAVRYEPVVELASIVQVPPPDTVKPSNASVGLAHVPDARRNWTDPRWLLNVTWLSVPSRNAFAAGPVRGVPTGSVPSWWTAKEPRTTPGSADEMIAFGVVGSGASMLACRYCPLPPSA